MYPKAVRSMKQKSSIRFEIEDFGVGTALPPVCEEGVCLHEALAKSSGSSEVEGLYINDRRGYRCRMLGSKH